MKGIRMTHILKWWLVFTLTLVATGMFVYTGLVWTVIAADITFISIGIVVLTIVSSALLGRDFYNKIYHGENINLTNYEFVANTMTKLGFFGTLIGMLLLVDNNTVAALASGDLASTKAMFTKLTTGIGTAVYTTLFGLVGDFVMRLQLRIVENSDEESR
jgi:hypothetical protein